MVTEPDKQRLDKWLWYARVTKTRSLAQKLISTGKIRIDGNKVQNSSQQVKIGNVLTITLANTIKILRIAGFADKRGAYPVAKQLYEDLSPASPRPSRSDGEKVAGVTPIGKPDKRQRREAVMMKQSRGR